MKTLAYHIAKDCEWLKTVNDSYLDQCNFQIDHLESFLPSGSGFDNGCFIDRNQSGKDKIIINFDFHHLTEDGCYDGWTSHEVTVECSFLGIELSIDGENKNGIIEYLNDTLFDCLNQEIEI